MSGPALVGVDWGTSSLRAYLLDAAGRILDSRRVAAGIMQLGESPGPPVFEATLASQIGAWTDAAPDLPILLSGMIGSRQGWIETGYVPCPVDPRGLADALVEHRTQGGLHVRIVPGLVVQGPCPDVMRGEETELVGAAADRPEAATYVMPGTHAKWVGMAAGRIEGFRTFMTGELFAVLKAHSILGRLALPGPFDEAAFGRGAAMALDPPPGRGGLPGLLFLARSLPLRGGLEPAQVDSFLSGLLVGSEVASALGRDEGLPLVLVGAGDLVSRYARVLAMAGRASLAAPPDAAARGLATLATLAGLLERA